MNRLAQSLIDHAVSVMPEHRRDWAEAMRVEFNVLPTEREALSWATGCVWASYCERTKLLQIVLKSLLRAITECFVVAAFIKGLAYLPLSWGGKAYVGELMIGILGFLGGIFATLVVLELVFARFWTAPSNGFTKTMLRAAVLGLWPIGWKVSMMIGVWGKIHDILARFGVNYVPDVRPSLIQWAGDFAVYFVAIFVPLLLCELAFAGHGRTKAAAV